MEFYLFNLYQKRLVPLGIEVVEDDRSLGNPGKIKFGISKPLIIGGQIYLAFPSFTSTKSVLSLRFPNALLTLS